MALRNDTQRRLFSAAFLAPALLLYTGFVFLPTVASIYFSLTNWRLGRQTSFVWLRNYWDLAHDSQYWTVALNSLSLVTTAVFIQVPLALLIAYALHWIGQGFRFYRSVLFLPVVIAPVAIGLLFSIFLNGDVGALNGVLHALGLEALERSWLADRSVVLGAVNVASLWHQLGLFVVIFIAAIRSLSPEIFEAAAIDGASRLVMLPLIVIPLLRDALIICIILAATIAIRAFDHSWIMTSGGPGLASSYFATLIYKRGFLDGNFSSAATVAVTLLVYVLALAGLVQRILLGRYRDV